MMASRTSNITFVKPFSLSAVICTALWAPTSASADVIYGPVQSRDTLSKIIGRLYTGSKASRLSVMKQIVSDNPSAFSNGDMNRLKLNASLRLSGSRWKKNAQTTTSANAQIIETSTNKIITADTIDRSAPNLTVEQLQGRMVFLDAERSSLIEQVSSLKRETARLEQKIIKLEMGSRQSDEQLRILDAEIIRLTALLKDRDSSVKTSNADLNQLVVLQEKLSLVQNETINLKNELANAKKELSGNNSSSRQANVTIEQLTQENQKLQQLLQDSQPGVHYFNSNESGYSLSLMSGKLQLPLWLMIVGGALAGLMLTALVATRRKSKPKRAKVAENKGINPFSETDDFNTLLETEAQNVSRGFAQPHTQAEENVFKMFDEGTLEMDLKLDMAEAYLEVSDFESARSILQEVVESGSELQKRKAARLIKKVA